MTPRHNAHWLEPSRLSHTRRRLLSAGAGLAAGAASPWRSELAGVHAVAVAQASPQPAATPGGTDAASVVGLIVVESPHGVAETLDRLEAILDENGLIVVARVDHAANATGVGETLPPTQLLIFGNPALGTMLLQASPTIGIDLPQKFLAWEDAAGQVCLAYNDPAYLAERHGLDDQDETIQQITAALAMLAEGATAP
ncbi:MAG: DUF302 domain-containing protein [Chloroflexota bacterium]|nr:DUF302 domain-containing protein [Chloroflexota bacterium]